MKKISVITPVRAKTDEQAQWLHEAIASVAAQTHDNWEHVVVNDHSPASLRAVKAAWPGVVWLEAEGNGVSNARNQAARAATGELLLPLDADDKLAKTALAKMLAAWDGGIVYSDVVFFGQDYARVYLAEEYDFTKLLHATFMTVGSLHSKEDWARVGGWRDDMSQGLEDWEYWIAMGEIGVCGVRVPEPLYWYRRHAQGRLAWLKANEDLWRRAYLRMRELHIDVFNGGRTDEMCRGCGGGARRVAPASSRRLPVTGDNMKTTQIIYTGPRSGDFRLPGGVTKQQYYIPGPGQFVEFDQVGQRGVRDEDVKWFLSIHRGAHYKVVEEIPAPPPIPVEPPVPEKVPLTDSEAWTPATMSGVELVAEFEIEDIDYNISNDPVHEIRASNYPAAWLPILLKQELEGKKRKTVIRFLEKQMDNVMPALSPVSAEIVAGADIE